MKRAIRQEKAVIKRCAKIDRRKTRLNYRNMKNLAKKVVVNFLRKKAEKELTKLNKDSNNIFTAVIFMKKHGKNIEGGSCIR